METNSTTNNKEMIDAWYEQVVSSCAHHDSDQAYSAWRRWDEMIGLVTPEQKSEVLSLQEQLAYTAFPSFPQDVAASLIEKHFVSFLRSPVDIDEMIQNRFLYLGYGFEEDDRQALRGGALKNQEQVGGRSVAEWLGSLDTALASSENPENVMTQFFTQDPAIAGMSRLDQAILRRLFQVYYDFLAFPVVTVYGLAETARKLDELEKSGVKEINLKEFFTPDRTAPRDSAFDTPQGAPSNRQSSSASSANESLPLLKALGKFEKLGGQQVTNSKIVVKGQNDPVRPTIFNWLRAYRDELGVGAHDAVARGQFLFHSLNGKGLSSDERDQVGMLLKSLDENVPLTIDVGRQEVLFQRQRTTVTPPAGGVSAVHEWNTENSGRTAPKAERPLPIPTAGAPLIKSAERPLFTNQDSGNISRAVFELPLVREQRTGSNEQGTLPHSLGTESVAGRQGLVNRPSAFEQARAIQEANRGARLSISNMNSETVELGKMETSREESRSAVAPLKSGTTAPNLVVPTPRAISFEPAKIDNFSFGASNQKTFSNSLPESLPESLRAGGRTANKISGTTTPDTNSGRTPQEGERPLPTRTEDFRPNFAPRDDMNVSALSFSTNHVLPAEKERIREQRIENSGRTAPKAERPLPMPTAVAPLKSLPESLRAGGTTVIRDQTVPERPLPIPTPVKKTPTAPVAPSKPPVNRFRITPTGHRDEAASDDTPSPHVVDLRG